MPLRPSRVAKAAVVGAAVSPWPVPGGQGRRRRRCRLLPVPGGQGRRRRRCRHAWAPPLLIAARRGPPLQEHDPRPIVASGSSAVRCRCWASFARSSC